MKIRRSLQSLFAILFLVVGFSFSPVASNAATSSDPTVKNLVSLAQQKIDAENDVLISGSETKLMQAKTIMSGSAATQVSDVTNLQLRRNKMLADHGQKYTKAVSKLTVEKADIQGDQATVTATENVTLTLVDKYSPDPVYTKEEKVHTLRYVLQGKQWVLVSDDVPNPFVATTPETGQTKITEKAIDINVLNNPTPIKTTKTSDIISNSIAVAAAISGSYNPTSAVNYARSYWNNYNSAYRSYGNDCTNFVSQAMNWGGWQHIGGWYDNPNYWWYSPNNVPQWGGRAESRTWINAHYFYFFARYAGRAYNAQYLTDFRLGDVLQVDFGTPDGTLDHTTIVTRNDGNGNIFLTYHSTNTLDISIWDFIARTPGANYYGTLFYYSY